MVMVFVELTPVTAGKFNVTVSAVAFVLTTVTVTGPLTVALPTTIGPPSVLGFTVVLTLYNDFTNEFQFLNIVADAAEAFVGSMVYDPLICAFAAVMPKVIASKSMLLLLTFLILSMIFIFFSFSIIYDSLH